MESVLKKNNERSSQIRLQRELDENHAIAMGWCVTGVISSLSASKLADVFRSACPCQTLTKRLYFVLLFSTVFSIGTMLKYVNKNKQLLEQLTL